MKIRQGFVSNSSASSFCIYGWTDEDLKDYKHIPCIASCFVKCEKYKTEYFMANNLIKEVKDEFSFDLIVSPSPDDNYVVGVGNFEDEIDHGLDEDEDWEDYVTDEPSKEDMIKLDGIAKTLGLPSPHYYSATWFNG